MNPIEKREISLRYWLLGKNYFTALRAMEFGARYHTGVRKDGFTPEFDHQISMAHFVRTLPTLLHPEDTLATIFLHDVREDYEGVSPSQIIHEFGERIATAVETVTKTNPLIKKAAKILGEPSENANKNSVIFFKDIGANPIASIVKGADRIHNFGSMVGVFSIEKQKEYLEEGEKYFLPMIKTARRTFPEQEQSYELIKHVLQSQICLIHAIHEAQ